jgi:hypothetical protein
MLILHSIFEPCMHYIYCNATLGTYTFLLSVGIPRGAYLGPNLPKNVCHQNLPRALNEHLQFRKHIKILMFTKMI